MFDVQALFRQFVEQLANGLALMQLDVMRAARMAIGSCLVLLPVFSLLLAEQPQVWVLRSESGQFLFRMEIDDRLIVAVADLYEVARQLVLLRVAPVHVGPEITAMPANSLRVFV